MKTIEYYTGTSCVLLCYAFKPCLMDFDELTQLKEKLVKDVRRVYKATGMYAELCSFCDLAVTLSFLANKIYIPFCGTKEQCQKIVEEAKNRHFKQVV